MSDIKKLPKAERTFKRHWRLSAIARLACSYTACCHYSV